MKGPSSCLDVWDRPDARHLLKHLWLVGFLVDDLEPEFFVVMDKSGPLRINRKVSTADEISSLNGNAERLGQQRMPLLRHLPPQVIGNRQLCQEDRWALGPQE